MKALTHRAIVSRSFRSWNFKFFSLCNALSLHKYILLALLACVCVLVQPEAAPGQQLL